MDPAVAQRVARVSPHQGAGAYVAGAGVRIVRAVEEPARGAAGPGGADRGAGGGLVHGAVLCAVFSHAAAQGRPHHRAAHAGRGAAHRYAAFYRVWHAVRPGGAQAHHHAGLRAGGGHVFPGVSGAGMGRQPRADRGAGAQPRGGGRGRPGGLLLSVQPHRHRTVCQCMRPGQTDTGGPVGELRHRILRDIRGIRGKGPARAHADPHWHHRDRQSFSPRRAW
ncbi:hypothetical protein D3C72_1614130 [compost metagenome]